MNKFVVFTGLDGSGKDFIANHIHDSDPTSHLISTPTQPFLSSRLEIDELAHDNPALHYFFYISSVIHASMLIEQLIKSGNVYCVRYLIDTVVYHRAMGLPVNLEYENELYRIKKPDLTVFLSIDNEKVRQERLNNRGKLTVGDQLVNNLDFRERLKDEYEKLSENFIIIENSNQSVADVVSQVRILL